jgi:site-specific DNA recombinase
MIVKTWAAAREDDSDISNTDVHDVLVQFDALWDELFPTEQARIVQLLVERIEVSVDGISIRLRTEGIASVIAELQPNIQRAA